MFKFWFANRVRVLELRVPKVFAALLAFIIDSLVTISDPLAGPPNCTPTGSSFLTTGLYDRWHTQKPSGFNIVILRSDQIRSGPRRQCTSRRTRTTKALMRPPCADRTGIWVCGSGR